MWIILAVAVVVAIYLVSFYNGLKTIQVQISASIQEIGNQLKRQSDLIPNLVESAKSYLKHEKSIFEQLTSARKLVDQAIASNDPKTIDLAQDALSKAVKSIRVVFESNPEIKASQIISDLMDELRDTADKVMYSRRTLIDLSADFNTKITTIPGIWIAPMMGFTPQSGLATPKSGEFLQVSEAETKTPSVKLD